MSTEEQQPNNPHNQETVQMDHDAGSAQSFNSSSSGWHLPLTGQFGQYELFEEIGRGGMGVVFKAEQKSLNRTVAVKMILGGRMASTEDLNRFLTEAEAAARLQHDNIVTVFEVGEIDGQHYFSMEYIDGKPLSKLLVDGPLPSRKAAEYVKKIAQAVSYAHKNGILHRDLKPSNILMDSNEEPHVSDFGLAKRLEGDHTQHTQTGAILGTPSYMAPEQASGKTHEIGPSCDIYGLGAVLYELLTGKPPFQTDNPVDTLLHVIQSEPVPPRLINPKIDPDLETICLKCLEKLPGSRYPSAQHVADDIDRYLKGEAISARSFNVIDRLTRILDRSQHDAAFHTWSTMLFYLAGIVLVEHILVWGLIFTGQSGPILIAARFSQFLVLAIVFWFNRGNNILPRTAAERELWSIWLGYLVSYGAGVLVIRSLVNLEIITNGNDKLPHHWDALLLYPISSLLSGLAFFIMGCNYWGRCYAIGLAFLLFAIISTFDLRWAPLEFGVLWSVALTSVGFRLRKLSNRISPGNQSGSPVQVTARAIKQ